jgi:hypothetical protein
MRTPPSETVPGALHVVIGIGIWYQVWHQSLLIPFCTVLTHCLPQKEDKSYASNAHGRIDGRVKNSGNRILLLHT